MNRLYKYTVAAIALVLLASCSDFLDETPDDRTTVDSKDKIQKLLVSAYPNKEIATVTELSTDNIADAGEDVEQYSNFFLEVAYWKDITFPSNEDTKRYWETCYRAIANANLALESAELLISEKLDAEKAEALMARAYSHFMLVNVFAKHYDPATASTDLGVIYMDHTEKKLNPKYKRTTVKDNYERINADIEAALPNISDDIYEQPKFHFNQKAAYAFAARFNLYYGKWEKAIEYANKALASAKLIDWTAQGKLPEDFFTKTAFMPKDEGVFLLQVAYSGIAHVFAPGRRESRLSHNNLIADKETFLAKMPWGKLDKKESYNSPVFDIGVGADVVKYSVPKMFYDFEYTDTAGGAGYHVSVINLFTSDETLLVRAEAKIHMKDYEGAMEDLNQYTANYFKGENTTTVDKVDNFYKKMPYSKGEFRNLTQKKKLNPVGFTIEPGKQENMLHHLLQCRRIATVHEGLRWYDIKRYGIEVFRFKKENKTYELVESLMPHDKRKALQIPSDIIEAGLAANPR